MTCISKVASNKTKLVKLQRKDLIARVQRGKIVFVVLGEVAVASNNVKLIGPLPRDFHRSPGLITKETPKGILNKTILGTRRVGTGYVCNHVSWLRRIGTFLFQTTSPAPFSDGVCLSVEYERIRPSDRDQIVVTK